MKQLLFVFILLSGCRGGEEQANQATPAGPAATRAEAPAALATLVGLYEGGAGQRPNQLCMVEGKGGVTRFGLVAWGANDHSCSGSGAVSRRGDRLRLAMAGDSSCVIEAPISGATVTIPARLPAGCAYYCGARASLGGVSFTQKGATPADALKATDLVGDPLCGDG